MELFRLQRGHAEILYLLSIAEISKILKLESDVIIRGNFSVCFSSYVKDLIGWIF